MRIDILHMFIPYPDFVIGGFYLKSENNTKMDMQ